MDGVDIIRKIRGWSEMPIIVVSARSEDQDKVEALDAGADDYLTKPFSIEDCWPACVLPSDGAVRIMAQPSRIRQSITTAA